MDLMQVLGQNVGLTPQVQFFTRTCERISLQHFDPSGLTLNQHVCFVNVH